MNSRFFSLFRFCRTLTLGVLLVGAVAQASADEMKFYVIDVGTGLATYAEIPNGQDRPIRVLYDTGIGSETVVEFLTKEPVSLRSQSGDFDGDIIDYFVLSHPHLDHFAGAKKIFENFDVRNIIESKQVASLRYTRTFKIPAIKEMQRAQERGFEGNYYLVGLPYPKPFEHRSEFNAHAVTEEFLPEILQGSINVQPEIERFPFGPQDVTQTINWPLVPLLSFLSEETLLEKYNITAQDTFGFQILPIGTRFDLTDDAHFTIINADFVTGLNPHYESNSAYKKTPYYREYDANDSSVTIQLAYRDASFLLPGDSEGRPKKPVKKTSLRELFGVGSDDYERDELRTYLDRESNEGRQIELLSGYNPYVLSNEALLEAAVSSYISYNLFNARPVKKVTIDGEQMELPTRERNQLAPGLDYSDETIERLQTLYDLATTNDNVNAKLSRNLQAFSKKVGGFHRMYCTDVDRPCRLNTDDEVWNIVGLVQIANRIHHVNPELANIVSGLIMSSDLYLDYVVPEDPEQRALRSEKHMIDLALQYEKDTGENVIQSDVLLLGHHGSFTSSSFDFVRAVDPNVAIISADDKVYGLSGGTLPDFLHLFWNLNTYHPTPFQALHSLFFHADFLKIRQGVEVPAVVEEKNYSYMADRIFATRQRNPIAVWRTDWNDDLTNKNILTDNIEIITDGREIWSWTKTMTSARFIEAMQGKDPSEYAFYEVLLQSRGNGVERLQPQDPALDGKPPMIRTFPTAR